jgi:hypothetical protein
MRMKQKFVLFIFIFFIIASAFLYALPRFTRFHIPYPDVSSKIKKEKEAEEEKAIIDFKAMALKQYAGKNGYSTNFCFLIDMNLHSGKNRFFVYDLQHDSICTSGLVAHGCGDKYFSAEASFSNKANSYCTSEGKYKIGGKYTGSYSTSYKLHGLDSTNSNAYNRLVVLHAYTCVPDEEPYPQPICNSKGCPMVSYKFLDTLGNYIKKEKKPILLWIFKERIGSTF